MLDEIAKSASPAAPPAAGWRQLAGRLKPWRLALGAALTALSLWLAAANVDWATLGQAAQALRLAPAWLGLFVALYTLAFLLRAVAWRILLAQRASLGGLFSILQTALFANHLLPVKAGEALRPYLAHRRGVALPSAVATTIVARAGDFVTLLLLAACLLPLVGSGSAPLALAAPGALLAGGVAALLLARASGGLPPGPWRKPVLALRAALSEITFGKLAGAALWTLPSWVLEGVAVYVAAQAMGAPVSPLAAVAVTAFTILFQTFHFTPGGIGLYEAAMTGALSYAGLPPQQALSVAVLAHALKFAHSYTVGLACALWEGRRLLRFDPLGRIRGTAANARAATRLEIVAARAWNVLNEGKPFTIVFTIGLAALLGVSRIAEPGYWWRAGLTLLALAPLFLVFWRFAFPLRLRAALWIYLALGIVLLRSLGWVTAGATVGVYLFFTVFLWGTVYYHLRIGTRWTNFTRFWRLVLENPDTTSGNFLEQIPKVLTLLLLFNYLTTAPAGLGSFAVAEGFIALILISGALIHQWFFTWVPPLPWRAAPAPPPTARVSRRVIAIIIDGCRADRLREAAAPCISRLRREGMEFTDLNTVYPARTVTGFSSMLTGAPPAVHGMRSNFAPRLGVRCDSVFAALRRQGLKGRLVGIAHLVDAFGDDVTTVTAVTYNDQIDLALESKAREVMEKENPDLLVLQLLSVDQTGHARGSYNREYLEKIEETDRIIERFLGWCKTGGYLDGATVLISADHGQGIGIGGHGHMTEPERRVPGILWGAGVPAGVVRHERRFITDISPTVTGLLGVPAPLHSVGESLLAPVPTPDAGPLAVIIPAFNEAANLPEVLDAIPRRAVADLKVIVVDDGSTDGTAAVARRHGAEVVISHPQNRGLGAALRTGLAAAIDLNARAAVYLDADGEYDPADIPAVLEPVLGGRADYALGSRYRGWRQGQRVSRLAGNLVFTALLSVAAGRLLTDGQTGMRAFSWRALRAANIIHDYNYAQVLTLDLLKKGMKLAEVPIHYRARRRGSSFVKLEYLWRAPLGMMRQLLSE